MKTNTSKNLANVTVQDSFWNQQLEVVQREVIPYQWKALNDELPDTEPSHAIENFRIAAGESDGEYYGMVFQDSDVAKWLEAVAYSLHVTPDETLEKTADELIDLLGRAQQNDGYLNTYYTIKEPGKRWTNVRDNHELYCAGHLIEAAVAYYEATGKRKFVDIMARYADYINTVFGDGPGQIQGYPGHQEIELALVKFYHVTGKEDYLRLSKYFIDKRGKQPHFYEIEKERRGDSKPFWWNDDPGYSQAHLPVREQTKAVGHSVRALYMYTAIADLAKETGDDSLRETSETLWNNVTRKQMYVTAGLGSGEFGEAFTFDYDLPNDTSYTETCASIALVFWADRMLKLAKKGEYADVLERALYNGTISGMNLDGKKFFYVNPLEVSQAASRRHDHKHVKPVRQGWFGCACCPPNLARMITSLNRYLYTEDIDTLYVHQYTGSKGSFTLNGEAVTVRQETNYPWEGNVALHVNVDQPTNFKLAIRVPGWCQDAKVTINGEAISIVDDIVDGYVYIDREWKDSDLVNLVFPMEVQRIHANPHVRETAGQVALQRGPVVYCLEQVDNGENLHNIFLPSEGKLEAAFEQELLNGVVTISGEALRIVETTWSDDSLYAPVTYQKTPVQIKAVPYFAWCNREPGEMRVWLNETK
ncbi:glycoside hydrolase family 127 protein [Aquibacillus salsiterrae]|uniref:Glycoside hydrolase family 127 protein n=1 Tax=Aquibacillus salsiterrae TaxID=2950439 RepID=A0A9X3WCH4_9BACI|nr:beta-L-arabinofuranosidase domain-containing protein [Aquibacillus salsiterrae]MDC3416952.1 glycoside hydrolase family 127 protein [Aquibacillus salsiterrae]